MKIYELHYNARAPKDIEKKKAHIIGGGIAGLSAALFLTEDCHMPGEHIYIYEKLPELGGSMDGTAGKPGYLCRGERELEPYMECFWYLWSKVPSLRNPGRTVLDEVVDFNRDNPIHSEYRFIEKRGQHHKAPGLGLDDELQQLMLNLFFIPETELEGMSIQDYFPKKFFTTTLWYGFHTMLASSLGENDSATIAAKANLERYKQEFQDARDKVKLLEGQIKSNSKTLQNNADAVSKATTDLNNAKAAVRETEAEIKKLTEALYRMESKWTKAGESLTAFSKKAETIGKAMTKTGKAMTAAITTPIVALGATAVKASIDYESAFTSVRKTVEATEEEFDSLSDSVKKMSTEVATSGADIAEVMAIAGQLGIANKHLVGFTRTMIDLGNSTDIVADQAASTLAKFANITGMDQSQFTNLGSALVDLGNNYATTESAIMELSMRLAAAGHQVGLSESQILGFAAALSSVGIEAEMGGSAFSKALIKMEVAAATGGKALDDFGKVSGMTAKEFKKLWDNDPAAAFQAFIVGLSRMDDEGESAIATLEEIGIKEVRLRDTLLRATNATELFTKTQNTANKAWAENTARTP